MRPIVPLNPGILVADHRVLAVIGSGSFGITYLATAPPSGAIVALKEFAPLWCAKRAADAVRIEPTEEWQRQTLEDGIERFLEEAAMLAPIEHPNIVRVERAVKANGTVYMIMAHVVGGTLSDRLRATTRLPGEAFVYGVHDGVRAGVQALHERGLVHRDIRAPNVLLAADDTPVLADFSLARAARGSRRPSDPFPHPVNTGPHTSPYLGLPETPSVDTYGLAALLYNVMTGRAAPRFGERLLMDPLVPLDWRLRRWFDRRLLAAVDAALNCDAADLPQSLEEWNRWTTGSAAPGPRDPPERAVPADAAERPPYRFITSTSSRTVIHPPWPPPGELTVDPPPLPLRPGDLT